MLFIARPNLPPGKPTSINGPSREGYDLPVVVSVGAGHEMTSDPLVIGFEKSSFEERTQSSEHPLPQVCTDMTHEKSCFGETCIGNLKLLFTVITGGDVRALREPIYGVHVRTKEG